MSVFLSYASEDAASAQRICTILRAAGLVVWFDQSELRGGDVWDQKIRREIRECALFVPIISQNTQTRTEGYFRLEWRLADLRTHLMSKGRAFIVPVCVDDTPDAGAEVPDSFAAVQWTRLPRGETPQSFVERLARLLSPDQPTVLPAAAAPLIAPVHDSMSEKSIAVLPFANLSADRDNEYFSDGLAEEVMNALSQVEDLRVASRSSAFFFKNKAADVGEIAAKLHVANVLEGSVRRAGNRVRITVQLVDAKNGFQLWSERYDRQMEDIFEIQDEIARAITERLKVTLGASAARSTTNLDAYELYLKGRHHWHQRSQATLRAAILCFEQAIKLDPRYALAYAGLADCKGILRAWGWMSADASRPTALAAVTQAMALAPSLWEVNFARAVYTLHFEPVWREAEPYFERAIAINPRSSLAHVYYGLFLVAAGRAEDAVAQAMLGCQLDPLSPNAYAHASSTLCGVGRFGAAERAANQALELQPDIVLGLSNLGLALCGLGRYQEAIESLERAAILSRAPLCAGFLGMGYALDGRTEDARRLLQDLEDRSSRGEYIPAFARWTVYVGMGDLPAVRESFAKALAESTSPLSFCNCGHFVEAFRADPEYNRMHRGLFGW
jgi:TolB-like protein/Tfp pilus assembly protein PilF